VRREQRARGGEVQYCACERVQHTQAQKLGWESPRAQASRRTSSGCCCCGADEQVQVALLTEEGWSEALGNTGRNRRTAALAP